MNKQLRKAVIAGNWKMNKTPGETAALIHEMKPLVADAGCEVILCVPFTNIAAAVEAAKGSNIKIGAQKDVYKRQSPPCSVFTTGWVCRPRSSSC